MLTRWRKLLEQVLGYQNVGKYRLGAWNARVVQNCPRYLSSRSLPRMGCGIWRFVFLFQRLVTVNIIRPITIKRYRIPCTCTLWGSKRQIYITLLLIVRVAHVMADVSRINECLGMSCSYKPYNLVLSLKRFV